MRVAGIRKRRESHLQRFEARDTGVLERGFHGGTRSSSPLRRIDNALRGEHCQDHGFGFIHDGNRPSHTEEIRFSERQEQIALERAGKNASVHQNCETVGEHRLELIRVEFGQLSKSPRSATIPVTLVGEDILGADATMPSHLDVRHRLPIQERNQMRPGDVEDVGGLLRGQHLIDGDEGHSVTAADMAKQFHQYVSQRGDEHDLPARTVFVDETKPPRVLAGALRG